MSYLSLGTVIGRFASSQGSEWSCFAAGMQWLSLGLCWLGLFVESLWNPAVLVCYCAPWLCISLQLSLILKESCPARGWQHCWEIDEKASLWLGGTLQQRSWLRDSSSKDKYFCYFISAINLLFHELWWKCECCFLNMFASAEWLRNYASCMMFYALCYACFLSF